MPQPLINGSAYSWAQIETRIFNTPIVGITAIMYGEKQEVTDNYGAGNRPVSRSYGKVEAEGSISLEMAEVEALQAATPDGNIMTIPEFDIVVSYLPVGGKIVTHTLKNCRFKSNKREAKAGEAAGIETEIELQISHIQWK